MRETWNAAREYYALSNAFKTYFSIYLKPREGRYFLVQVIDDLRGSVSVFELIRRFWLLAGVDDAINRGRDYFLGLHLRFDDEDLKPLIRLGAVAL
ncbi:MAG: hypothetical protein JSU89_11680 [Myxococcales bacterium]|nr:MAG: hypothetical protein JSU89_11680 [Myxococcales bacterium]